MNKFRTLKVLCLLGGLASANAASMDQYAYDELGRLTAVRNADDVATEAYRYDGVGNIVEKTIEGETYRLTYDQAHQLESAEGPDGLREFVYDKAGRLKSEVLNGQPVVHYTYGYLDKVIAVERNGQVTRFDYDAQGMLVGKQLPDGSYERWTWDGMGLVARGEERYINEGHVTGGLPLVSQTSEGVHYHQHDHLGTTVASYSTDGEVTASYETTVFGKGELEDSRAARFTGKPYDADLGAYVFPFRNYDPEAARWMSADPAGFPDGPNNHFYAAVPTMGVDPLGLEWQSLGEPSYTNGEWHQWWGPEEQGEDLYLYRARFEQTDWEKTSTFDAGNPGEHISGSYSFSLSQQESYTGGGGLEVGALSFHGSYTSTTGTSETFTKNYNSRDLTSIDMTPELELKVHLGLAKGNVVRQQKVYPWNETMEEWELTGVDWSGSSTVVTDKYVNGKANLWYEQ